MLTVHNNVFILGEAQSASNKSGKRLTILHLKAINLTCLTDILTDKTRLGIQWDSGLPPERV